MNDAQRQQFLRRLRAIKKEIAEVERKVTRFEKELVPHNIIDNQKAAAKETAKVAKTTSTKPKKEVRITGGTRKDAMYDLEVEFSKDGDSYGNPLVNPEASTEYYVRVRIRQHQDEPFLLQGFTIAWQKPSGWVWVDGHGQSTTDETVSNPTVITRVARSPATERSGRFRAVVTRRYFGVA